MSTRKIAIVLTILFSAFSLLIAGCGETTVVVDPTEVVETPVAQVKVWNFNMCNHCPEWPGRITNMANWVAEDDNAHDRVSDLFAFNEARNKTEREYYPDVAQERQKPIKIYCGGIDRYTPECFGILWRRSLSPEAGFPLVWVQYGENGLLARGDRFILVGDFIRKEILGVGGFDKGSPIELIGGRFRIIGTDMIVPFYVTHLRHDTEEASENIINTVLNNWVEGDLPPIVVGDFNIHPSINAMKPYFVEMGNLHGQPDIEHIWVGCGDAFYNTQWTWLPVPYTYSPGTMFDDDEVWLEELESLEYRLRYLSSQDEFDPEIMAEINELRQQIASMLLDWEDHVPYTDHRVPSVELSLHPYEDRQLCWSWLMSKITVGDFDGDSTSDVSVLYGYPGMDTGLWVFDATNYLTHPDMWWRSGPDSFNWSASKLVAGDFNNDGFDDIAVLYGWHIHTNDTGLRIFDGASGLAYPPEDVWRREGDFSWEASKMVAGDFNNDGFDDIAYLYGIDLGSRKTRLLVRMGENGLEGEIDMTDLQTQWRVR